MQPHLHDVVVTALRWISGLSVAIAAGLLVSFVVAFRRPRIATARRDDQAMVAVIDFLRSLPIIALVPVVQLVGVQEGYKIALIAWAAAFPILISTRQALRLPMIDLELTILGSGLSPWFVFWRYALPKALLGVVAGVEVSIGVAWIAVVAAEWLGNYTVGFWSGGLGVRIVAAHDANSWPGVIACLVAFGVLGTGSSVIWRAAIRRLQFRIHI